MPGATLDHPTQSATADVDRSLKILDLFDYQVRESGAEEFVADVSMRLTYAEADQRANQIARVLDSLQCSQGQRVALLSHNRAEYVLLYLAAAKAGAVTVPLNFRLAPAELEFILNDSGATVVVAASALHPAIDAIRSMTPSVKHYVSLDPTDDARWAPINDLADAESIEPPSIQVHSSWPLSQLYTSGTTGTPKGVVVTHGAMAWQVEQEAHVLQPLGALQGRFLAVAPMYHAAVNFLWMTVAAWGGSVFVQENFDPVGTPEIMAREDIAWMLSVPAMMHASIEVAPQLAGTFPSLKVIYYGGSTIDPSLLRSSMEYFGCEFLQVYGLTETLGMVALNPRDHRLALEGRPHLLGAAGRSFPGCRIGIIGIDGQLLPEGEVGEIVLSGPQIMTEYWNRPEATRETLQDGWLRTGDAGYLDSEGYLYITDRIKDMIISGGENIYPREIEEVLLMHPNVVEVAVVGIPDTKWGESVAAVVVPRHGGDSRLGELLVELCVERLAKYKVPKHIDFVDALPRNAMGKVQKFEIRNRYWSGHDRRI
ncbi:long-chain-fatty-acid--CoA ligase [Rhodococcus sp. USK13]|uniref:class I adenylate-forming enzyme family protein n=1 Tax=Rhodococcus sp. USK13 TaxID=2806442 RepID=UPI001BD17EF1|nr:long-chain-fatty-acid--CoA ligase [Rhodococcus sp. USK13]